MTGGAGTGKTTLLKQFVEKYPGGTAVVAPTGIAALNCGGQTIHKFFGFPARSVDKDALQLSKNSLLFRRIETLVIDEISMVRADVMDNIDFSLRKYREQPDAPFGGVNLLLVGDLYQLPPVVVEKPELEMLRKRYGSEHFFSAPAFKNLPIRLHELLDVKRQSDLVFTSLLNALRIGKLSKTHVAMLNTLVDKNGAEKDNLLVLCPTNRDAAQINQTRLSLINSNLRKYIGIAKDKQPDKLPAPQVLELKVGARVMFTKNNGSKWVNGTVGTIRKLDDDEIKVKIDNSGRTETVLRECWENFEVDYDANADVLKSKLVGTFEQFPLMPAWATTIHKSQGQTLERVHIDLGSSLFSTGQLYVALSRATTLEGVSLSRSIRESDVKFDGAIESFMSRLREFQPK